MGNLPIPRRLRDLVGMCDARLVKYGLASIVALGSDAGLFLLLLGTGMGAVMASASGYCAGILVHWLVSSRLVFAEGAAARGSDERTRQKALFVGSALVGLAITTAIVGIGTLVHGDARIAKLLAILVSFQATYLLRRHIVFRAA